MGAAIWEKATLTAETPNARIDIDGTGDDWVRVLSPSFKFNDGSDFTYIGMPVLVVGDAT